MGALFVPVIAAIVVIVLVVLAIKQFTRAETEHSDRLQTAARPTVRYAVPAGQDPAAVLTELRQAGFDASADSEPGPSSPILIIGSTGGGEPDRERLRVLLAAASVNIDPAIDSDSDVARHSVRFLDE
jgi:hypothetical protein